MKIVFTANAPWTPIISGAVKSNRLLLEALVRRGHTVEAVVPAKAADTGRAAVESTQTESFLSNGVRVTVVNDPAQLRNCLSSNIRSMMPDIVLVSSEDWSQTLLDTALRDRPGRVVYLARNVNHFPFGPQAFFPSEVRSQRLGDVAAIACVSGFVERYVREHSGMNSTAVPISLHPEGTPPQLGRFDGKVTMINASAIKGVRILEDLARALPEVDFMAVRGWGTTARDVERLHAIGNVAVCDPTEDVNDILRLTSIVLVPSLWAEAFPRVVIESMARGVPVIASDVGGNPEAKLGVPFLIHVEPITSYGTVLDERLLPEAVVPEQEIGPWIEAVRALRSDPGEWERVALLSRRRAIEFLRGWTVDPFEALLVDVARSAEAGQPRAARVRARPLEAAPVARSAIQTALDNLTPEQRAILTLKLQRRRSASSPVEAGSAVEPGGRPLSVFQRGLWIQDRLDPANPAYNIPAAVRLRGPLNEGLLISAQREVIRRHAVLRSTFGVEADEPVCLERSLEAIDIELVNLEGEPQSEAALSRFMHQAVAKPFDLSNGPLMRAALVRMSPTDHLLLVVCHHIVTDNASIGVYFSQVSSVYNALAAGQVPQLSTGLQYDDFARWQLKFLTPQRIEQGLTYWREHLGGELPLLNLPADYTRPPLRSHRGARHYFQVGGDLAAAVRRTARAENCSLFVVLLATFELMLHRYTGETDVRVGCPVAFRRRPEFENLIGFFVNTLVIRTRFEGQPTLRDLLARVRQAVSGALSNQDVPLETLVERLHSTRRSSRSALFEVMFSLRQPPGAPTLDGVEAEHLDCAPPAALFDLTLSMVEAQDGLRGSFEYSTDLFSAETIERMTGHYLALLESMCTLGDVPAALLPMLSPQERETVLALGRGPRVAIPADVLIHQLVESVALQSPERQAFDCGMTYGELDQAANRMARLLDACGVTTGSIVAVWFPRSPELVVAALAAMKTGAAYLPIDPSLPAERVQWTLRDSKARVIVTEASRRRDVAGSACEAVTIGLSENWDPSPLPRKVDAEDTAYVVYTSGSTGVPKGVEVRHRSLLNIAHWYTTALSLGLDDRISMVVNPAFDVAVGEIWPCLITGGCLCVPDAETILSPEALRDWLADQAITVAFLPTPLAESVIDLDWPAHTQLRILHTGGDELRKRPSVRVPFTVLNDYGPAECTVWATSGVVEPEIIVSDQPITIGGPLPNYDVHVLDRNLQVVPLGVTGEICIGGVGVAKGYLYRPELTAERFVKIDPGDGVERVFYRTGDLGRFLPDGRIVFLGRTDGQVKIRGARVETGEVEAVLLLHPLVREAAVTTVHHGGERRLVAVVRTPETAPRNAVDDIRSFLRKRLPGYMVPSTFAVVDRLPLSANGKIDRRALSELAVAGIRSHAVEAEPPTSPIERALAAIWSDILNLPGVSLHDNFFDVGGHSLLASRVLMRAERELGVRLRLTQLFDSPTIREFAEVIAQLKLGQIQQSEMLGMFDEIEQLSDDAASSRLAREMPK